MTVCSIFSRVFRVKLYSPICFRILLRLCVCVSLCFVCVCVVKTIYTIVIVGIAAIVVVFSSLLLFLLNLNTLSEYIRSVLSYPSIVVV